MTGAMQDDTSCANINIIDDASFESDHSFTVHVTSVELELGGTDLLLDVGMPAYATINIEDNDRESTLLQCCSYAANGQWLLELIRDSQYIIMVQRLFANRTCYHVIMYTLPHSCDCISGDGCI